MATSWMLNDTSFSMITDMFHYDTKHKRWSWCWLASRILFRQSWRTTISYQHQSWTMDILEFRPPKSGSYVKHINKQNWVINSIKTLSKTCYNLKLPGSDWKCRQTWHEHWSFAVLRQFGRANPVKQRCSICRQAVGFSTVSHNTMSKLLLKSFSFFCHWCSNYRRISVIYAMLHFSYGGSQDKDHKSSLPIIKLHGS